jgi:O-antigen/teichoic acid export membrane protein
MSALRTAETAGTPPVEATAAERAPPSGARSGALLAAASLVATVANYLFLLACGRFLGSDDYGSLAALLGLLTVVLLPTGAVQLAISREIAHRLAEDDQQGAAAFSFTTLRLGLLATAPLVAIALALAVPFREVLKIDSTAAVLLAAVGLVAAFAFPVATGALLGYQRFRAVAGLYVLPFALRLALLGVVAAAGFHLGGAVFAAVAGGAAAAVVAVAVLREALRRGARAPRPALGPFLRYLVPVVVGLIGIAVLTNADVLIVKARFSADAAGEYAAASAFARVAFFLPATILAVLFPRTAARQARGEETEDILGRTLLVTAAFCALLVVAYALTGRGLMHMSFGAEFADGGALLWPFAVTMSLYSLANVLVGFHLSRGETRYAWIVASAVAVQVPLLTLLPLDLRQLIWTNAAVAVALLAAHELYVGSSVPALRAGLRHFRRELPVRRRTVIEGGLVLAGAAAVASIATWPLVTDLGSAFLGTEGSDASGGVAWLWRLQHESGYHLFGTAKHVLTGAPFGWEEGNGLNLNWLIPYYPAYLATKVVGPVAAYNLVVLSGYALSGATMYLLCRYLGCTQPVAAWAGFVYVLFPWHIERAQHPSLIHIECLVLVVLALVAAAEKPVWSRFSLVALATLSCWLTSGYYGAMAAIGSVVFAVAAALTVRGRGARTRIAVGTALGALAATALMAVASVAGGVGNGAGLGRSSVDLGIYGLRLEELVVPTINSTVFGHWTRPFHEGRMHESNGTEVSNYLGLLTIVLAATWLVVAWRRRAGLRRLQRAATAGLASLVLTALAFALPSPVGLFGHSWTWTPARLLWEFVPAFRVPSRWTAFLMAALVPLAALGLQAGWRALAERRVSRAARLGPIILVAAAFVVSTVELAINASDDVYRTHPIPAKWESVSHTPDGILAVYPLVHSEIALLGQTQHGRPLLNGAGAGSYADEVGRALVDPAAPGTAKSLALLGVSAIVTNPEALDFVGYSVPDVPNARWGPGYALVARFQDGSSVWRVTARPAAALATLPVAPPDFVGPDVYKDGFIGDALTGKTGDIHLWAPDPTVVTLNFDARSTSRKRWTLRIAGGGAERSFPVAGKTRVAVPVSVPRGFSRLHLTVDPDPDAGEFPLQFSPPWTERTTKAPQLKADILTANLAP